MKLLNGKFLKVCVSACVALACLLVNNECTAYGTETTLDNRAQSIHDAFRSAMCWGGADGAMTVELGPQKVLWLFGDTWIVGGNKIGRTRKMINNSVAIQEPESNFRSSSGKGFDIVIIDSTKWSFCFQGTIANPKSIFQSNEEGSYYWPGCGIKYGGKLYLLLKKIRKKDDANPLFRFDWYAEDLLIVSNPGDAPALWKYSISPVSASDHKVQFGLGCTKDRNYLYSLCYLEEKPNSPKKTILARVLLNKLDSISAKSWEYFCDSTSMPKGSWLADFQKAKNIIPDGGPEMSLFFHDGLKCFVSVYQPPLSPAVNLRVARKIEGPWSEPMEIFKVPERTLADGKTTALVYAGKAHECLSDGHTIIFSYCENPGGLEQHMANPDVYFPTVRTFTISDRSISKMLDAADVSAAKP